MPFLVQTLAFWFDQLFSTKAKLRSSYKLRLGVAWLCVKLVTVPYTIHGTSVAVGRNAKNSHNDGGKLA
jgi:hypothetical protein